VAIVGALAGEIMETSKRMPNDGIIRQSVPLKANNQPIVRFTLTASIPISDPPRKTGKFLSLPEACEMIGITPTTYRRKEGKPFPAAKRLDNNYGVFTNGEVEVLRKIWNETRSK